MILSHREIEEIAAAVMKDFNQLYYRNRFNNHNRKIPLPQGTPIDEFASWYLKLKVSYTHLSSDGTFCGLTAYADTEYTCEIDGITRTISLKQNEVLLDNSFIQQDNVERLLGKRRFTLAHECAHQILFQLENDDGKAACRRQYAARHCYSLRDLKSREDWNEWQANALGAAILMPMEEVEIASQSCLHGRKLMSFEGRMPYMDRGRMDSLCKYFGVSKSAMRIRLKQLGCLEERPASEFYDPLEIYANE